jgi:hypothetical protein
MAVQGYGHGTGPDPGVSNGSNNSFTAPSNHATLTFLVKEPLKKLLSGRCPLGDLQLDDIQADVVG